MNSDLSQKQVEISVNGVSMVLARRVAKSPLFRISRLMCTRMNSCHCLALRDAENQLCCG
jgi:hypothetical protein